jgi:uncharacterized membrane-anchored protein YjiN (DUF445 family)
MTLILVYQHTKGQWKFIRYQCPHCEKNYVSHQIATNHLNKCTINTLKQKQKQYLREAKTMPIQRIIKNGEPYYRWGDNGKLYKDRADAEAQARAAYASGYREPTQTKDQRAEAAGRKVTKDLEYDMYHDPKDDKKAERAGRRVTKDIEYDMKRKR